MFEVPIAPFLPTTNWVPCFLHQNKSIPSRWSLTSSHLGCRYQIWISIPKLGPSMVPWRSRHSTRGWMISDNKAGCLMIFVFFLLVEVAKICGWFPCIYIYILYGYSYTGKHLLVQNISWFKTPNTDAMPLPLLLMQLQQESLSEVSDSSSRKMWTLEMS